MAWLPAHNPDMPATPEGEEVVARPLPEEVVKILEAYRVESEQARDSGPNPRTGVWDENIERYWGRYDMSDKADWQSKLVLPEVPQFVDRWASAMRDALDASPDLFAVEDEGGNAMAGGLVPHITKLMKVLLGRCSRTPDGHYASFSSLFEEQMKLGAMMALCASVTWKYDKQGGRVGVDTVDPREVWYDPKGRNLYRRRRYAIDKHELIALATKTDEYGLPIYNVEQIMMLGSEVDEQMTRRREASTGHGQGTDQGRDQIIIDEWLGTVILDDGRIAADGSLMVVANEKFLIRGPEQNPYHHQMDWLVFTPMVSVPLSVYGRTYMEEWAPTADAYIEMTNLILDSAQTSAMKAFVVQAAMLADPTQVAEGISPNKVFQLEEGLPVADFLKEIDMGTLSGDAVTVWQALRNELREGAKLSEVALGQLPDKTHIAASGVNQAAQSGSAMIRSMAKTIEQRWLEPILQLVWMTALQYMDFNEIADEIGQETAQMFNQRRLDFLNRKIRFRVRGISGLIDRQMKFSAFMQFIQAVSTNPGLLQAFMQKTNFPKLLQAILVWLGIDPTQFEFTQTELLQQQLQQLVGATGQQPGAASQPRLQQPRAG